MDYLVTMITKGIDSISPMARQSGDSNRQEDARERSSSDGTAGNKMNQERTSTTAPKRATTAKASKVRANIDDRFKAVSSNNNNNRKRPPASTSRIDPWISNYVQVFLKNRSSISNFQPKEGPMIEILNRGGPFWDYKKHFDDDGGRRQDLEGWMLVSDGLHSIKVWLTKECRDAIWQQVTASMTTPMYAFHGYSARQCGILEKFSLKPIDNCGNPSSHTSPACELLCDSFRCQPQMQYMVVSDPSKIQNVNDYVKVKHAYQAYCQFRTNQSGRRWGDAKKVVDNPPLFDAILKVAERKVEQANKEGKSGENENQAKPAAALAPKAAWLKTQDSGEEDDEGVPSMNIHDMLASPTEENEQHPSKKSTDDDDDDETDYMGSLTDSALLGIHSQPLFSQEPEQMMKKENAEASQQDDTDSVIEIVGTTRSPRKRSRNMGTTTSARLLSLQRNGKRIKFRTKEDWPNLPAFAAFCKQLNDPSRKVIDIPGIQQPRVSLKNDGLGHWLNQLGY
mmetsp:Transcript_21134/g.51973  ORF Transcript_21134/g.51973 Transcript_21134/m.51973 type:complete len:509 (-) Transcript_21134:384-1910(-)